MSSFVLMSTRQVGNVQTCEVSCPGLPRQEWQRSDWCPCVSNLKAITVTHCPFGPALLKNVSALGDPKKKDPALWALMRSENDVDGSPLCVSFRLSQPVPFVTVGVGLKGCELFHVDDLRP